MRYFIAFLFTLTTIASSIGTPLDSIGITKQEGKFYIKYLVEPGETIYRISTKYGIPVSDLLEENPELEKGLKTGQVLLIPYLPEKKPRISQEEDESAQYHTVEKGETFFSIARKYNIPVGDLLKMNNIELKAGQKIVVSKKGGMEISPKQPEKEDNTIGFNAAPTKVEETQKTTKEEPKSTTVKPEKNISPTPPPANTGKELDATLGNTEYNNATKRVIVIPFDPYLYFSDADDEIAAVSKIHRTKVRQAFRRRLNAYLEPKGFETVHLMGGNVKDSTTDLNRAYSSISYTYDNVMMSGLHTEMPDVQKSEGNVKKTSKSPSLSPSGAALHSRSTLAKDEGKYFAVRIKDPNFFPFFNAKYKPDYYIFISQFEVKTNYENCLDRARQNYERTFVTHFSIFDKSGTQISGGRLKSVYESGNNNLEKILADNIPNMAERIMAELPKQ